MVNVIPPMYKKWLCSLSDLMISWYCCMSYVPKIFRHLNLLPCFSWKLNSSSLLPINVTENCWIIGIAKQCRPRSDAAFCSIWSGSTLFDQVCQSKYSGKCNVFQSLSCIYRWTEYLPATEMAVYSDSGELWRGDELWYCGTIVWTNLSLAV